MNNEMFQLADRLKDLKERKKELEEEVKGVNSEIEEVDEQLSNLMVDTETQSFNRSGTLIYLNTKTYASAVAERKQELYEALKNNGYGSLITETINANSLSAFVKEMRSDEDEALPQWLQDKVNIFEKTTIGIRRSK